VTPVGDVRAHVYDLVVAGVDWPTYLYLPDSADDLPCYVVGRPSTREQDRRAMMEIRTPVYALGRRLRDDDAQRELDAAADTLHALLWKPGQEPGMSLRLTTADATVVQVAGVDVPAYTATVVATIAYC
jgi:hypothetical protein